jgi:hypothetical protein
MPLPVAAQDTLASACRRPSEDLAIFRGTLAGLPVLQLLELMERIGCTGRLLLFRDCATLNLDWFHGRVIVRGARRAFAIASQWHDGDFELLPITFDGNPPTLSVAELTIDVAREIDERSRQSMASAARL